MTIDPMTPSLTSSPHGPRGPTSSGLLPQTLGFDLPSLRDAMDETNSWPILPSFCLILNQFLNLMSQSVSKCLKVSQSVSKRLKVSQNLVSFGISLYPSVLCKSSWVIDPRVTSWRSSVTLSRESRHQKQRWPISTASFAMAKRIHCGEQLNRANAATSVFQKLDRSVPQHSAPKIGSLIMGRLWDL